MTEHNYLSDPKTPFFSLEDDVDDETFLKSGPNNFSPATSIDYNYSSNFEDNKKQLYEAQKAIVQRTLESSKRSVSLLRDSEEIGISTAEELVKQREQLERTESRLDDVNATLRYSQKHIQGIKSIFGSVKNYFSGSNRTEPPQSTAVSIKPLVNTPSPDITAKPSNTFSSVTDEPANHRAWFEKQQVSEKPANASAILEKNLDEMSGSLARLKGLAIGLSSEIDMQNDLIDNITDKVETADTMMQKQNKDIRQLLRK